MKKFLIVFVFLISCTSATTNDIPSEISVELTYQSLNGDFVTENLSNKSTIIIFWADYWGICRQELPALETNLDILLKDYDVLALAHSDLESTNFWVNNNLKGLLKVGLSTDKIRDKYKVIGQPLTIILNNKGEIIFREYGYIPINGF